MRSEYIFPTVLIALGFCAAVVALPLIILAAPFALAWWFWNETDEDLPTRGEDA